MLVENLFHLSFLVRDGHARISKEDEEITVKIEKPPTEENIQKGLNRAQAVLKLDYNTWERLKINYNSDRPIIPTNQDIINQHTQQSQSSTQKSASKRKKK